MELSSNFGRLFFFGLVPLVKAYTVFETTCSAPNPHSEFMFVSAPDTRGTLNILWSSLFTIFACTWTLQHPDVPKQRNGDDPGKLGTLKWMLKEFSRSTGWMILTVLAPEYIIGQACRDLVRALQTSDKMKDLVSEDHVPWTLRHSYCVNMKGFAIRCKQLLDAEVDQNKQPKERKLHPLSTKQVLKLRKEGVITSLPSIKVEEIKDRSKNDTLGKTIAIVQILWTIVQIIARAVKRVPVSPLEIAVVAFAVCAVITYGLYFKKPQRVSTPIVIYDYPGEKDDLEQILRDCYENFNEKDTASTEPSILSAHAEYTVGAALSEPENPTDTLLGAGNPESSDTPAENNEKGNNSDFGWGLLAGAIGAAVFGGVHVLAWNFAFPTRIELICWRYASVYSAAFPLSLVFIIGIPLILHECVGLPHEGEVLGFFLFFLFTLLYIVARLFILVEIFRTLSFLPAGSFVATWSTNIPHVG